MCAHVQQTNVIKCERTLKIKVFGGWEADLVLRKLGMHETLSSAKDPISPE